MFDTRDITKKQLCDLARVTSEDGWMTTGQLRRVTGLKHSEIYARTRQLRVGCKREFGIFLFLIDDVLAAIRADQLPVQREAPTTRPQTRTKFYSIRMTGEEAEALDALVRHFGKTTADVVRDAMLEQHKRIFSKK